MTMSEIVDQVSFLLGMPANDNVENMSIEMAVKIAFRELTRYIRTPVDKTVPYSPRIDLKAVGINTKKVLYCQAAQPRIGMTLSTIDSANVFQVAASVNTYGTLGNTSNLNIDPIMTEMAMAQVRNTLGTDFQWKYDASNQVVYCAHRDPRPAMVTIRYVPNYQDVSEIVDPAWIDYLVRMSTANMKLALGRSRSKYTVEGSNVSLDGDTLLAEANAELEAIRNELGEKRQRIVILN